MGADIAGLLASLGGGGGGPGGPPPGPPPSGGPDLGALLGGAGAGGGPAPDQGGGDADPVLILTQMMDLANKYGGVERDEEDKLTMQKIMTMIQQLKAKDQADQEAALGGGNMRIMRKAGAA